MTLTTLAGLSGLSASFLCRIENGQRELCRKSHLQALASVLRIPPVELVPWVLDEPV
jgi:transcriptional regulator with XRE-family HTH domain